MATNVDGMLNVGQAVARCMIPRGRGRIVNGHVPYVDGSATATL